MRRPCSAAIFVLTLPLTFVARPSLADASGCSHFSRGQPGTNPQDGVAECLPGGAGCYECAYDHRNLSGYDLCAEPADGDLPTCTFDVATIPDWWPDPDPSIPPPDPTPPPGDNNPGGTGDDGGGGDPGDGGGGGDLGGPYDYAAIHLSYLYPVTPHRPYNPLVP